MLNSGIRLQNDVGWSLTFQISLQVGKRVKERKDQDIADYIKRNDIRVTILSKLRSTEANSSVETKELKSKNAIAGGPRTFDSGHYNWLSASNLLSNVVDFLTFFLGSTGCDKNMITPPTTPQQHQQRGRRFSRDLCESEDGSPRPRRHRVPQTSRDENVHDVRTLWESKGSSRTTGTEETVARQGNTNGHRWSLEPASLAISMVILSRSCVLHEFSITECCPDGLWALEIIPLTPPLTQRIPNVRDEEQGMFPRIAHPAFTKFYFRLSFAARTKPYPTRNGAYSDRALFFLARGCCTTRTPVMLGSINKDDSTFEIAAMQYISATNKHEVFPVRCLIPDSPRWQKCKPVPANNELVCHRVPVEGEDNHTSYLAGLEEAVKHFIVNVDQVVLGQSDSVFFGSQDPDVASEAPSAKKRKPKDDCAVPETNDNGEGTSAHMTKSGDSL
ncbi:hypothetical protein B0H19DRAFT_1071626 [Mycena capillaripes]|nr:hypothetical protein B0H19DRAFT_1071626 [Mycena capillaripes]